MSIAPIVLRPNAAELNMIASWMTAEYEALGNARGWLLRHSAHLCEHPWTVYELTAAQQRTLVGAEHPGGWIGFVDEHADTAIGERAHALAYTYCRAEIAARYLSGVCAPTDPDTRGIDAASLSARSISVARAWLITCGFDEHTLTELTDRQVAGVVARRYTGGWAAFAADRDQLTEIVLPIQIEETVR